MTDSKKKVIRDVTGIGKWAFLAAAAVLVCTEIPGWLHEVNNITDLEVTKTTDGSITLSWPYIESPAIAGYYVYRSTNANGTYNKIDSTSSSRDTTYTDDKVDANKTYYYKIAAHNSNGKTANQSNAKAGTTKPQDPNTYTYALTVNRSPNAGGSVSGGGSYASGASVTVEASANADYEFTKWTVTSGTAPSGVNNSTNAELTFKMPSNNLTLTANFQLRDVEPPDPCDVEVPPQGCPNYREPAVRQFIVAFNTDGGTPTSISPVSVDSGTAIGAKLPTAPAKTNYTFAGWFSGNTQYTAATVINAAVTLTAKWEALLVVAFTGCDDKVGETVEIGTQTWMKKNLDCKVSGVAVTGNAADTGRCYGNSPDSCDKYGRLYNWVTAMNLPASYNSSSASGQIQSPHQGVCPAGWHIPTNAEWNTLSASVGGTSTDARKLKAQEGWNSCGPVGSGKSYVCEDAIGFAALPGGYGSSDGSFGNAGDYGGWWSASKNYANYAFIRSMHYRYEYANGVIDDEGHLFSVRCVRD